MNTPTQTTSQTAGPDAASVGMTLGFIMMKIVDNFSRSEVTFWLTVSVGASTLLYNAVRIYKEFKPKRNS